MLISQVSYPTNRKIRIFILFNGGQISPFNVHLKRFSVKLYRFTLVKRSFHKGEEIVPPMWYDHSTKVERYKCNEKGINIPLIHGSGCPVFRLFIHRVVFPWMKNRNRQSPHPTAKINFSNVINDSIHHDYYIFFYSLIFKSLR